MSGTDGTQDAWAEWTTPGAAAFGVAGLAVAAVGHLVGGDDEGTDAVGDVDRDGDADQDDVTQLTRDNLVQSTTDSVQLIAMEDAQQAYGDAITSYCDPDGPGS